MGDVRFGFVTAVSLLAAVACAGTSTRPEAGNEPNDIRSSEPAAKAPRSCQRTSETVVTPLSREGGTVVLAEDGDRTIAVIADADERAVTLLDVDSGDVLSTSPLDGVPSQLAVLEDGRVVVALRDRSKLVVLQPGTDLRRPLQELCRADTPTEPVALTLSPKGDRLYAVTGWGAKLTAFDTEELRPRMSVDLPREPREVVIDNDGKQAFVAHAVGGRASVVDLASRAMREVSTTERTDHDVEELRKAIKSAVGKSAGPLSEGQIAEVGKIVAKREADIQKEVSSHRRTSCQSFALARSADSGRIFVPQVLVDPGDENARPAGYGDDHTTTEVPNVAVIDPSTGHAMATSLRVDGNTAFVNTNEPSEHCILPRSAAVDEASGSLLVGCFGTDVVIAYDARSPDPARVEKRRWRVAAGPSGIVVDDTERRAVVWSQFDRTVNVIRLTSAGGVGDATDDDVRKIEIPSDPERQLSVEQLLGRSLFHSTNDARIARDGRACASCHPDGREDGLVWATPNGPRRTKLLAGSLHGTAPFAWDGDAAKLHDHLEDTFERLRGAGGLRSVELRALTSYVKALPSPPRTTVKDPQKVARGKEIFESKRAGCATCHAGEHFTDNKIHDVKSKTKMDREAGFNTPSLAFLRGRAPYYHDGRYATLSELLAGVDGAMGHTKHLSKADRAALEAFLLTL